MTATAPKLLEAVVSDLSFLPLSRDHTLDLPGVLFTINLFRERLETDVDFGVNNSSSTCAKH